MDQFDWKFAGNVCLYVFGFAALFCYGYDVLDFIFSTITAVLLSAKFHKLLALAVMVVVVGVARSADDAWWHTIGLEATKDYSVRLARLGLGIVGACIVNGGALYEMYSNPESSLFVAAIMIASALVCYCSLGWVVYRGCTVLVDLKEQQSRIDAREDGLAAN